MEIAPANCYKEGFENKLVKKILNRSIYFFEKIKILLVIQTENQSATSSLSDPLLMRVLPHTVLGAEVILESYAEVYSYQFTTGNSPFQLVQCSTVPNNKRIKNMIPFPYNQKLITCQATTVSLTELLRRLLVKIENIYLF